MKKSEEIAKEIFYKPATNGKATRSIKEGAELIDNYVKEQLRICGVEGLSEQLKCLMDANKPNCDCELNHCLKKGW